MAARPMRSRTSPAAGRLRRLHGRPGAGRGRPAVRRRRGRRRACRLARGAGRARRRRSAGVSRPTPTPGPAHPRPLRQPDRRGRVPPAWHELLEHGRRRRAARGAVGVGRRQAAHLRRAAGFLVWSQVEAGHGCPVSMTYAAVPALRADPALAAEWEPGLTATVVRPAAAAARREVRAAGRHGHDREAGRLGRAGEHDPGRAARRRTATYALTGHKWFCSAPMCDVFLMLAQAAGRADLLRGAAGAAGRHAQRVPASSGSRTSSATGPTPRPRSSSTAPGRGGSGDEGRGVAHHHRDGHGDPARLRAGLDRADAPGRGPGDAPRSPPLARSAGRSPTSR